VPRIAESTTEIDHQRNGQHNLYTRVNASPGGDGSCRSGKWRIQGGLAGILARIRASCLRCRGLRSAGLDAGPAAADDDDDDEECKPMPGPPTSPPACLSRSRDSFSARNRSSRFMIFFSRVLDIAPERRDSSALLNAATCLFWFLFLFFLFLIIFTYAAHQRQAHRTRHIAVVRPIFNNFRITLSRAAPFWQQEVQTPLREKKGGTVLSAA